MKLLYLILLILFVSVHSFCQPNYKATVFSTDISSVSYYWPSNSIIKENVLLFNAEDEHRKLLLYAYNLENNTLSAGKASAPWHNNMPLENIYQVNGTRVMVSSKDNLLYKFTKDSLTYASPYFSPYNTLGYHIQLLSFNDIIVYKNKLYFQGFIVPNDTPFTPCAGEAALMTWDGVNAPTTAPLVYFGHSSCYTTGLDNDPGNRFSIKNLTLIHDTLFYAGGKAYDGSDFYYLDKNDSSVVAIPKGNDPADLEYIIETYVVGEYMYFWAIQKNGRAGFFKYKGINQLPEKVAIVIRDEPSNLDAPFFGDHLFMRAYIDAVAYPYLIHPDGTITVANHLENFYNTISNDQYILSKESGTLEEWKYIPANDLNAEALPATELNQLTYYTTSNNGSSSNGITIKGSGLSYLGNDGDWILFRQTTYHRMCKNTNEMDLCDTILYKNNIVVLGPEDRSPLKAKDPFFEDCNITYTIDVKHIADCRATDFPSDSRATGEIKLTLSGKQSGYEVTFYRSNDKENWSALQTTTYNGSHIYEGLTKGFYKASIKESGGCILQTPYYEIKSLTGKNKKTYEEFQSYYTLDSYGSLPVNITFITPNDTTESAINFEFIDKYRVAIGYLEGESYLIHTDISGCKNVDTFTVGITNKNIKTEFLCDSTRFYFDVTRGIPPFKVTITEQDNNTTNTILTETYQTFFHFDKKIPQTKMSSLNMVVEDAMGKQSLKSFFKYTPTISFPGTTPPNCGGIYKSDGNVVAIVNQSNTLAQEPYIYSWNDDASIKVIVPDGDVIYTFLNSRDISDYGEYTFQIKDTIYGCIYENTVSVTDPYEDFTTDLDHTYEICANQLIEITSAERVWFSSSPMLNSGYVGNTFNFYNAGKTSDTIIYYAPFNTMTGCFASKLDSFKIKNFDTSPIVSDTLICTVGDTISFTAQYNNTQWYVDSYNSSTPPLFTGKVFDFKTSSLNHTIYAVLCDIVFDEVKIQHHALSKLHIISDFLEDSIRTCKPITLHVQHTDTDATVHWISALDTLSGISPYSIPVPFTASVYAIQQIENCISTISNGIYIDRYHIPAPVLLREGNKLYTNTADSFSWYLNGQYIAHDTNVLAPDKSGYYHVLINDKNGCTSTSNVVFFDVKNICNCVYPIPTHAEVFFDFDELESVTLFNSVGAEIAAYKTNTIDLSRFASALYIAKIKLKDGSIKIEKVIKY